MKVLAIETATEMCSVALWWDGAVIEHARRTTRGHSDLILGMLDDVLGSAATALSDCDAVAYGSGPGSFTALRIGAGVVQGIALGTDLPVIGVSSLQALAQRYTVPPGGGVLAAFDARVGEVYWRYFVPDTAGIMTPGNDAQVGTVDTICLPDDRGWLLVGGGVDVYLGQIKRKFAGFSLTYIEQAFPRATEVALLASDTQGKTAGEELAQPKYVRQRVTEARPTGGTGPEGTGINTKR